MDDDFFAALRPQQCTSTSGPTLPHSSPGSKPLPPAKHSPGLVKLPPPTDDSTNASSKTSATRLVQPTTQSVFSVEAPLDPPSTDQQHATRERKNSWSFKRLSQRMSKHLRLSGTFDYGEVAGLVNAEDGDSSTTGLDPTQIAARKDTERAIREWDAGRNVEAIDAAEAALKSRPFFIPALVLWRALYRVDPSLVTPASGREELVALRLERLERATERARDESIEWIQSTIGPTPAAFTLIGSLYRLVLSGTDPAESVTQYKLAAEANFTPAMCNLAMHISNGLGIERDPKEAFRLYKISADAGNAMARHCMAMCYEKGDGVEPDLVEAFKYYKLTADMGYAMAQYFLARFYADGKGVARNERAAAECYALAADQGLPIAQEAFGLCLIDGRGVQQDETEGARMLEKAAAAGLSTARANLAKCFARGMGVKKDEKEAVKLWRAAAAQGEASAVQALRSRGISV